LKVEEPISSYGQLDLTKSYTYLDYLKWTFDERVELIKGKILKMSPAPSWRHQNLSGNLYTLFEHYFKKHSCKVFYAPIDVCLPIPNQNKANTVVQPDLCILCDLNKLDDHGIIGSPDLIVEILSPGNVKHDLTTKFNLYEEAGVPEYWIVDYENKNLIIYSLKNKEYAGSKIYTESETAASVLFPEIEIRISDLFAGL
jgi:Uma2 family endonuclease